jgi:hypothetical protein
LAGLLLSEVHQASPKAGALRRRIDSHDLNEERLLGRDEAHEASDGSTDNPGVLRFDMRS